MPTFFRKRPPYNPRATQSVETEDDFPVVGPASEDHDDFPVLSPETELDDYEHDADEDFPIVGPAADVYDNEDDEMTDVRRLGTDAIQSSTSAAAAQTKPTRQFKPSSKIRLPQAPAWVQEQAASMASQTSCELPKSIPIQLENAIQVIINNEMEEAEKRIKQKVLNELKNYFENH